MAWFFVVAAVSLKNHFLGEDFFAPCHALENSHAWHYERRDISTQLISIKRPIIIIDSIIHLELL